MCGLGMRGRNLFDKQTHALFLAFAIIKPLNVRRRIASERERHEGEYLSARVRVTRVMSEEREVQLNPKAAGLKSEDLSAISGKFRLHQKSQREGRRAMGPTSAAYRQAMARYPRPTQPRFSWRLDNRELGKADPTSLSKASSAAAIRRTDLAANAVAILPRCHRPFIRR